jgi:hypothetical protein
MTEHECHPVQQRPVQVVSMAELQNQLLAIAAETCAIAQAQQ